MAFELHTEDLHEAFPNPDQVKVFCLIPMILLFKFLLIFLCFWVLSCDQKCLFLVLNYKHHEGKAYVCHLCISYSTKSTEKFT